MLYFLYRFNQINPDGWNVNDLLEAFSRENWNGYCLAHLFTYKDFDDGVIGLAYISKKGRTYGGVCSPKNEDNSNYENCALTTYVNWGRPIDDIRS